MFQQEPQSASFQPPMYCEEPMFGYDGSELNVVKPLVSSPCEPSEHATVASEPDDLS